MATINGTSLFGCLTFYFFKAYYFSDCTFVLTSTILQLLFAGDPYPKFLLCLQNQGSKINRLSPIFHCPTAKKLIFKTFAKANFWHHHFSSYLCSSLVPKTSIIFLFNNFCYSFVFSRILGKHVKHGTHLCASTLKTFRYDYMLLPFSPSTSRHTKYDHMAARNI